MQFFTNLLSNNAVGGRLIITVMRERIVRSPDHSTARFTLCDWFVFDVRGVGKKLHAGGGKTQDKRGGKLRFTRRGDELRRVCVN